MLLSTSCCSTTSAASSLASVTSDIFAFGAGNVNAAKFAKQSFEASKVFFNSEVHFNVDRRWRLLFIMSYNGANLCDKHGIEGL